MTQTKHYFYAIELWPNDQTKVKFGYSKDPERRILEIQGSGAAPLAVLAGYMEIVSKQAEKALFSCIIGEGAKRVGGEVFDVTGVKRIWRKTDLTKSLQELLGYFTECGLGVDPDDEDVLS